MSGPITEALWRIRLRGPSSVYSGICYNLAKEIAADEEQQMAAEDWLVGAFHGMGLDSSYPVRHATLDNAVAYELWNLWDHEPNGVAEDNLYRAERRALLERLCVLAAEQGV